MNIGKIREIEDLKEEFSQLQSQNNQLYQAKVEPALIKKRSELLDAFSRFFEDEGFDIEKLPNKVVARYKSTTFQVALEGNIAKIYNGNEQFTDVFIEVQGHNRSDSYTLPVDKLDQEITKLKRSIETEKRVTSHFNNPIVTYTARRIGRKMDSAEEVIKKLFAN
ncbi:hypothetical protein [Domibacillus iocasae]|uniref:Uncharacterized protein n=1 Tax=Domibacillus iocasae TaxID=1714016 RepID=A0A1E7DQG7_9BACI|nr:hypothetical protein [Domibacillus iocasae]OES45245.1 hypothetical protein BA724_04345 [Domibacillus iocasae]